MQPNHIWSIYVFDRWNRLTNYILVIKNAVPSVFCDEIVNYYEFSNEWKDAKIGVAPKESGGVGGSK